MPGQASLPARAGLAVVLLFGELQRVLNEWKPAGWTAGFKEDAAPDQPKQFLLVEAATGGTMALVLHRLGRIYFSYRPSAT